MGEIKSVKVDNWGVFFLQKLQNFFNKTDYCDLTLQFNDNSQLKVHKLVLNACTDYFNILEQTCEMIDDVLIMPNELQADLVVPIVNFMYTGTLEFELKMYGKLLKTARDMNMTVLLKLLEAHRRTMEGTNKTGVRSNSKISPRTITATAPTRIERIVHGSGTNTGRKILTPSPQFHLKQTSQVYPGVQIKQINKPTQASRPAIRKRSPQSTTIARQHVSKQQQYENMIIKEETITEQPMILIKQEPGSSSPFEQLRSTGYNNKRPMSTLLQQPPAKKPNIQDVKEYAEQQRMRKQIAEEFGEDQEYTTEMFDDEYFNDDDDDDQQQQQILSQQKQTDIQRRGRSTDSKPTIVVKDSTSSNVDHAKIISEVLRKYPHLIKHNKNIKLKIMPNNQASVTATTSSSTNASQKIIIKNEPLSQSKKPLPVAPVTFEKPLPTTSNNNNQQPPRRIDAKTMKALIALGAENTTGPWLCLRCGVNGRPISIPSYRGFRRHLINTHKEKIDIRLCEHCGWRSTNTKELSFHMYTDHQIRTDTYEFPKCEYCKQVVLDSAALDQHIDEIHPDKREDNQQCIYCNKTFATELMLYNHMKAQHKERAREDGVIDFSEDEEDEVYDEEQLYSEIMAEDQPTPGDKVQILSDINLPKCISLTQISKQSSGPNNLTEGIASSLGLVDESGNAAIGDIISTEGIQTSSATIDNEDSQPPKFVNPDGTEMELTEEQRTEILKQLETGTEGGVVMMLNESFTTGDGNHDEDNKTEIDPEKSDNDPMSWIETESQDKPELTDDTEDIKGDKSEDEEHDKSETEANVENENKEAKDIQISKQKPVTKDKLVEKLKELTDDWSEDDDVTEDEEVLNKTDDSLNSSSKATESPPRPKSAVGEESSEHQTEDADKTECEGDKTEKVSDKKESTPKANIDLVTDAIERELAEINREFEEQEQNTKSVETEDNNDEIKIKEEEKEKNEENVENKELIIENEENEKTKEIVITDEEKGENSEGKTAKKVVERTDSTDELEENFTLDEPMLDIPTFDEVEEKSEDAKSNNETDEKSRENSKSLLVDWADD